MHLISMSYLQKHRERGFKYIHIGLVQVGIKPLTKEGLNASILVVLSDNRFINFQDSLISSVESSLCSGPISFNCFSNFTISLNDQNILKSLVLQINNHNYKMLAGSIPIALVFKVHYNAMQFAFATKHRFQSGK